MVGRIAAGMLMVGVLATACSTPSSSTETALASVGGASPTPAAPSPPPPLPTPRATQVAGHEATLVRLIGTDPAPIDAITANGSIWVALHRGDAVVRLDPTDGSLQATIAFSPGTGPGWFAVGDGSVWVTNQNSVGISRIDPATNEAVSMGTDSPCGPPTFVDGSAWINACDAPALVGYDADTETETERGNVPEPMTPAAINGELWAFGESGTYRLDPASRKMKLVGHCCAALGAAERGGALWLTAEDGLHVMDLRSRKVLWEVPLREAVTVAFAQGSAWVVAHENVPSVTEIDLQTHKVVATVPAGLQPVRILAVGGRLWITDMLLNQVMVLTP